MSDLDAMTETQLRALCEQLRADLKEAKRKLAVMPAPRAIRDTVIRLIREYSRTFGCSEEDTADAIIATLSASPAASSQEGEVEKLREVLRHTEEFLSSLLSQECDGNDTVLALEAIRAALTLAPTP